MHPPNTIKTIVPEVLNADVFRPFGEVIEVREETPYQLINEGTTRRYHRLANVEVDPGSQGIISIFRGEARSFPLTIDMMERHPHGSQSFFPLNGRPYLVAVCRKEDEPIMENIRFFSATGSQGVNYLVGVWHFPLIVIGKDSDFLVVDREGPGTNCDIEKLAIPFKVNLPDF